MNVNPGGAQPKMRDTVWDGKVQRMVYSNGRPKRMRQVLEERGIDTNRMNAPDMRLVLGTHIDFKYKKQHWSISCRRAIAQYFSPSSIVSSIPSSGFGEKQRAHCDYSCLERTIISALESVQLDTGADLGGGGGGGGFGG